MSDDTTILEIYLQRDFKVRNEARTISEVQNHIIAMRKMLEEVQVRELLADDGTVRTKVIEEGEHLRAQLNKGVVKDWFVHLQTVVGSLFDCHTAHVPNKKGKHQGMFIFYGGKRDARAACTVFYNDILDPLNKAVRAARIEGEPELNGRDKNSRKEIRFVENRIGKEFCEVLQTCLSEFQLQTLHFGLREAKDVTVQPMWDTYKERNGWRNIERHQLDLDEGHFRVLETFLEDGAIGTIHHQVPDGNRPLCMDPK